MGEPPEKKRKVLISPKISAEYARESKTVLPEMLKQVHELKSAACVDQLIKCLQDHRKTIPYTVDAFESRVSMWLAYPRDDIFQNAHRATPELMAQWWSIFVEIYKCKIKEKEPAPQWFIHQCKQDEYMQNANFLTDLTDAILVYYDISNEEDEDEMSAKEKVVYNEKNRRQTSMNGLDPDAILELYL
jgi:hypothetical protein